MMIVKVQVSLNDGGSTVLVYNKDRTIQQQFPGKPEVVKAVGPAARAFFFAKIVDGILELEGRAPEQGW
jgi:hypothetical protein